MCSVCFSECGCRLFALSPVVPPYVVVYMALALNPNAQDYMPTSPLSSAPCETYYCYPTISYNSYSYSPYLLPFPGPFYVTPYHNKFSYVASEIQTYAYPELCYLSYGTFYCLNSWCSRKEKDEGTEISYTPLPLPSCQLQQKATLIPLSGQGEEVEPVDPTSSISDSTKVIRQPEGVGVKDCRGVSMASCTKSGPRKIVRRFEVGGSSTTWQRRRYIPRAGNRRKVSLRGGNSKFGTELEFKGEEGPTVASDGKSTVMIRNLPNNFTKKKLLQILDSHCLKENHKIKKQGHDQSSEDLTSEGGTQRGAVTLSQFDFLYLPIDFRTGNNMGYAFVNFTSANAALRLYNYLHNWIACGSRKTCAITYARIQGLKELVKNFSGSTFMCNNDAFLPACFTPPRDGSCPVSEQLIGNRLRVAPRLGRSCS